MVSLGTLLDQVVIGVVDPDRAAEASPTVAVLHRKRIIDWAFLARIADVATVKLRPGIVGAGVRIIFEFAGGLLGRRIE